MPARCLNFLRVSNPWSSTLYVQYWMLKPSWFFAEHSSCCRTLDLQLILSMGSLNCRHFISICTFGLIWFPCLQSRLPPASALRQLASFSSGFPLFNGWRSNFGRNKPNSCMTAIRIFSIANVVALGGS